MWLKLSRCLVYTSKRFLGNLYVTKVYASVKEHGKTSQEYWNLQVLQLFNISINTKKYFAYGNVDLLFIES